MAGKTPNRTTQPGTGPKPINARKVVGRGINGGAFYSEAAYHQSAAYRLRGGGGPPQQGGQPPQPTNPGLPGRTPGGGGTIRGRGPTSVWSPINVSPGNRLPGVSPTFPHPGAPPAPGTADQHVDQVRTAIVRGGGGM